MIKTGQMSPVWSVPRSACALVLIYVLATSTSSADSITCLDDDVRAAFYDPDYTISSDHIDSLPAALRKLEPPEGFRFVGSGGFSAYARIGFITPLDVPAAEMKIVDALLALGYTMPPRGEPVRHGQVSMCHPYDGSANVRTRADNIGTVVTVTKYYQQGQFCVERRLRDLSGGELAGAFLPILELPQDALAESGGSHGGGLRLASTRVTFTSVLSGDDLISFFGHQLEDQGWRFNGKWASASASGSTWSSSAAGGELRLIGSLEVRSFDESRFAAILAVSMYD